MDGTRMGSRSSTRHGPTAVFSGPVRRWKKTWVPVSTPNTSSAVTSRALQYKWVPLTPGNKDEAAEEPGVRPSRYLPVSVVLAQRKEAIQKAEDEAEAAAQQSADETASEPATQADTSDQPMESAEVKEEEVAAEAKEDTESNPPAEDTPNEVEMKDEAEDDKTDERPSQVEEQDGAQGPSESSAGSEGDG